MKDNFLWKVIIITFQVLCLLCVLLKFAFFPAFQGGLLCRHEAVFEKITDVVKSVSKQNSARQQEGLQRIANSAQKARRNLTAGSNIPLAKQDHTQSRFDRTIAKAQSFFALQGRESENKNIFQLQEYNLPDLTEMNQIARKSKENCSSFFSLQGFEREDTSPPKRLKFKSPNFEKIETAASNVREKSSSFFSMKGFDRKNKNPPKRLKFKSPNFEKIETAASNVREKSASFFAFKGFDREDKRPSKRLKINPPNFENIETAASNVREKSASFFAFKGFDHENKNQTKPDSQFSKKFEQKMEKARQKSRDFFSFEWVRLEKKRPYVKSPSIAEKIGEKLEPSFHNLATTFDYKKKRSERGDLPTSKNRPSFKKMEEGIERARQESVNFFSFQWFGKEKESPPKPKNTSPPLAILLRNKSTAFFSSHGISSENKSRDNLKRVGELLQNSWNKFACRSRESESYKNITPELLSYSGLQSGQKPFDLTRCISFLQSLRIRNSSYNKISSRMLEFQLPKVKKITVKEPKKPVTKPRKIELKKPAVVKKAARPPVLIDSRTYPALKDQTKASSSLVQKPETKFATVPTISQPYVEDPEEVLCENDFDEVAEYKYEQNEQQYYFANCYESIGPPDYCCCYEGALSRYPLPKRISMGEHIEERGIGYRMGYATLDILWAPDYCPGTFLSMFDTRISRLNNDTYEGDFGYIGRYIPYCGDYIYGFNTYFDFRQGCFGTFNQIGVGFEILSCTWDFRANAYFPIRPNHHSRFCHFDFGGGFCTNTISTERDFYAANMEFGGFLIKNCDFLLYASAGPYYLANSEFRSFGGSFRLSPQYLDFVQIDLGVNYDSIFKWSYVAAVYLTVPLYRFSSECRNPCLPLSLCDWVIYQPVRRWDIIPIKRCKFTESNF